MNRKFTLLWMAPLLLGFNAAWADNHEDEDAAGLPDPAADEARGVARINEAATKGLTIAAEKTAGLPAEATIRLMNDADGEDSAAVTHDVELPTLPAEGAAGEQGLALASNAMAGQELFGLDMADDAADAAQNAAENIENRGRAEDMPADLPGRPGDLPPLPTG